MSPITSLRSLTEPAFALVGIVLPADGDADEVQVLTSPESVVAYPGEGRELLTWFGRMRSRSDALAQLESWGGTSEDLGALVGSGLVVELPADEAGVRELLARLAVAVTAPSVPAADGSVLLQVGDGRAVPISALTAAVIGDGRRALGVGVEEAAAAASVTPDVAWRILLTDLTGVLTTGAGHLVRVGRGA